MPDLMTMTNGKSKSSRMSGVSTARHTSSSSGQDGLLRTTSGSKENINAADLVAKYGKKVGTSRPLACRRGSDLLAKARRFQAKSGSVLKGQLLPKHNEALSRVITFPSKVGFGLERPTTHQVHFKRAALCQLNLCLPLSAILLQCRS